VRVAHAPRVRRLSPTLARTGFVQKMMKIASAPNAWWLLFSVALNVLLGWMFFEAMRTENRQRVLLEREVRQIEERVHNLYRVLPKGLYTRNEFALAITLPGQIPDVRDCLVQYGEDVFVFDRSNFLIGIYPAGPNPFVREWKLDSNYKCDSTLLDAQTRRRHEGAAGWEAQLAPARQKLLKVLNADDPAWGRRGAN
jgi:hypothetical protein